MQTLLVNSLQNFGNPLDHDQEPVNPGSASTQLRSDGRALDRRRPPVDRPDDHRRLRGALAVPDRARRSPSRAATGRSPGRCTTRTRTRSDSVRRRAARSCAVKLTQPPPSPLVDLVRRHGKAFRASCVRDVDDSPRRRQGRGRLGDARRLAGRRRRKDGRERVAIIGAGAGGVAAAYFLAGSFDVDLFEARSRIGGHCDSRVIKHRGRRITVDLGAQFFHPDTHPIYVTLLEELGLYDPEHPDADATLEAPASLCIFRTAGGAPIFSSSQPLSTPQRAIDFATFTSSRGRRSCRTCRGRSPSRLDPQPAPAAIVQAGRPVSVDHGDDRVRAGRRAASVGAVDPADVRAGVSGRHPRGRHHVQLEDRPAGEPAAHAGPQPGRPGAPQHACAGPESQRAGWFLRTPAGRKGPYRFVVLNAPPRAGRELLRPLPAFAEVTALLDVYRSFDSRLLVHTDLAYMPLIAATGGRTTPVFDGLKCEGSAWLGALQEESAAGASVDVFKSWAQRRSADPKYILRERRFKHPLISRSTIEAARAAFASGPEGPVLQRPLHHRHGPAGVGARLGHEGRRGARSRQPQPGVADRAFSARGRAGISYAP